MSAPTDVTVLMCAAAEGDKAAADQLLPLVYDQLRKAAQIALASESAGHTLSATAVVHEAYMKLVGPREVAWASRAHFYVAAAEAVRWVLLDHAKARGRKKRRDASGRPVIAADFASVADLAASGDADEIQSLDDAFCRLEAESPQAAQVVRLRFYAGLTVEQTALAMGTSERSVNRLWTFARAWLHRAVHADDRRD